MSQEISSLFEATLHANPEIRKQAEQRLKQMECSPSFLPTLLSLIAEQTVDINIRVSAVIFFKNQIRMYWAIEEPPNPISVSDRQIVRDNLVQTIVASPQNLRYQGKSQVMTIKKLIHLCTSISTVLAHDYPEKWPHVTDMIKQLLDSSDFNLYHSGLLVLKEMVAVYRWKTSSKRQPLEWLIANVFDSVLSKSQLLLQKTENEVGSLLHLALKIYYMSIQCEMSIVQRNAANISAWGTLFVGVIEKNVPLDQMPSDLAERELHPWMKAKKWALHCIYHLFSKHADPAYIRKDEENIAFSKMFLETFAPKILQVYLNQLQLIVSGGCWTTKRVKQQISLFFADAVKYKSTWTLVKPALEPIISRFIHPQLCFSDEDLETFDADPVEFLQSKLDPIQDYRSPTAASRELLLSLVKNRSKFTFMPILEFINQIFSQTPAIPATESSVRQSLDLSADKLEYFKRKDGAMAMLSCVADYTISKKSPVKSNIQQFLVEFIFPEFSSEFPLLQVRACETIMSFSEVEFDADHLVIMFKSLASCMQSPWLAVKAWAVMALGPYLQNETFQELIRPHAPEIMQVLLALTNEIESDSVTEVMNCFVEYFSDELIPCAVQLADQMKNTFMRIASEIDDEGGTLDLDANADKTMAAVGVLKTLGSLILSVESSPAILQQLTQIVLPLCYYSFQKNIIDVYEEVLEIIDSCSYCSKAISNELWEFLPLMHKCFKDDGLHYLEDMLPSLDNYLTFGRETIKTNPQIQAIFFDFIDTCIQSSDSDESDIVKCCELMESMMLNLGTSITHILPKFIEFGLKLCQVEDFVEKAKYYKVHVLEIIVNAIYNDSSSTIEILIQGNTFTPWMNLWLSNIELFTRVHDKKLCVLAICSLLQLFTCQGMERVPPSVSHCIPMLMQQLVGLLKQYPEALDERKKAADMIGDDDSVNDNESDILSVNEDDDVYNHEEECADQLVDQEEGESASYDEDDFFDMYGLEEDPYFITILDDIDPYLTTRQTLASLPDAVQQALGSTLDQEQMAYLKLLL